tara:strand:- start:34289 stop:35563 length:1275 start_codon:yes stop_codon:yes gene_type:complete
MATPTLTPVSQTSAITLPSSSTWQEALDGSSDGVFPFSVYTEDHLFLSGAADQVGYAYKKLGGDVLDVEITKEQVYTAYQEATLEYSYIVNIHQAKNSISDLLGASTGSFDEEGQLETGHDLEHHDIALKFPRFKFDYARRVALGYATEAGLGGQVTIYSASFDAEEGEQDYDLQTIVSSSALDGAFGSSNPVGNKRINITKVFYKTPQAMWRFYGYYGGLNTVGDLSSYGQYADDSTFQLIPTWQNKAQAMAFEDAIWTRNSHYSYELKNNKIRIFPSPTTVMPEKYWIEFFVDTDAWEEDSDRQTGINGVNNMNTLPFENLPYKNINAIGKQWIRRFALSLCKEMLGNIRSKFGTIPIPGDSVTLDGAALISQGQTEQEKLREELKTILDELTYTKIAQTDVELSDAVNKIQERVPMLIFTG